MTRVFICYSHTPGDSEFAKWLFEQLRGPDFKLDPKMDVHTLGIGTYWSEAIPAVIKTCEMLLFVRSRFAINARVCRREIDAALVEGLEIANLRIDSDATDFERTWGHMSVDFSRGREAGLRMLKDRLRQRQTPEGRLLSMTYSLDHHRDRLRHADGPHHAHHQREAERLEREIAVLTNSLKRASSLGVATARREPDVEQPATVDLVERVDEAAAVRAALKDAEPGVLIVSGPAGVGKTTMVRAELDRLLQDEAADPAGDSTVVHYHLARAGSALGATILTGSDTPKRRRLDPAGGVRQVIDKAISDAKGARAIIVIDAADHLQGPVSHRLVDLDLEDVFERLYDHRNRHRIKILLVCREAPQASPDKSWLLLSRHVRLDRGLTLDQFARLLRRLDRGNDLGVRTTSEQTMAAVHRFTCGSPRLAELMQVSAARGYAPLSEVARGLSRVPIVRVPMVVFNHVIDSLDESAREVLTAVAAFGTPIDESAIRVLLPGNYGKRRVEGILQWLVRRHVVDTAAGLFYVREPDRELVLQAAAGRLELLKGAAALLRSRAPDNPRRLDDLDLRLSEIAIWLTAGQYIRAFTRMEDIEPRLAEFNRRDVLLSSRLRLRGNLSRRDEAINTNALGQIYLDKGRLQDARLAFEQAVTLSEGTAATADRLRATSNLAHTLFLFNDTATAERYFEAVRIEATDPSDPEALALALHGLADCCERRGAYKLAFDLLDQAASLRDLGPVETLRRSLKRARSLMELGQDAEAYVLIQQAAHEPQVRTDYLVALATYQVDHDDHENGIATSTQAALQAVRDGDRELLRQARTALAVAHLANRDYKEASGAISLPARTRGAHVELSSLAVQGVSRFKSDPAAARSDLVQLLDEARTRLQLDPHDYVSFDFAGLAWCGLHLWRGDSLDRARSAFEEAGRAGRPPGVPRRLIRLLRALQDQVRSNALDPVISSLEEITPDRSDPDSAPG
ncbi:AAA family ATPase [Dactylosporangium sp. NPDC049742]|uniref:AAA family ATPase n=1 Tax=Dactylosporangium sp. NPDC049742 TaxID=3154737 RepID=UPI00344A92F9